MLHPQFMIQKDRYVCMYTKVVAELQNDPKGFLYHPLQSFVLYAVDTHLNANLNGLWTTKPTKSFVVTDTLVDNLDKTTFLLFENEHF